MSILLVVVWAWGWLNAGSGRPNQVHKKAIEVDAHLRVKGAPIGEVYAIGDASTVRAVFSSR